MRKAIIVITALVLLLSVLACRYTPDLSSFGASPTATKPAIATRAPSPTPAKAVPPGVTAPPALGGATVQLQDQLINLYDRINPGVVSILVESKQGGSSGSGFVYNKEGHIITNYHVVEGATDLEVDFPSGFKARGKVLASDLDSDIAVVKITAPAEELYPLPLGNSDSLKVGQLVVAIGNPFGLNSTLTLGVISAKGRTLSSIRQSNTGTYFSAGDIIQTDASINPGNSGGPLINLSGEVVGINRAIRTTGTTSNGDPVNSGIGFAISINIVKRVVPVLIKDGRYDYPYMGISASEISLMEQELLGVSTNKGIYVLEVVPGGPAEQAGLKAGTKTTSVQGLKAGGDMIIEVDGRPVLTYGDIVGYIMANKSPGDKLVFKVLRGNEQKELTLTLVKRPR